MIHDKDDAADAISQVLGNSPFEVSLTSADVREMLEVPPNREMGDFAFPCFSLAKSLRKAPPKIATELAELVQQQVDPAQFDRVVATGPYLNLHVATANLAAKLLPRVLDGTFLARRPDKHTRVMIEYSQPNSHKAFHVGHTRNVALGDALVRICEWDGNEVVAANYIGDEGAHIAKCLWYYCNYFSGTVPDERRGEFLGGLYANATQMLDFKLLTQAPHPQVITARVVSVSPHPKSPETTVVVVDTGKSSETVVCGGTGFSAGDIVAYAQPGARIKGRLVQPVDKAGVASNGMICAPAEISLGEDDKSIHVFPAETPLGVEIAELLRIPGALPDDVPVLEEMRNREAGVSQVLQALEKGDAATTALWKETRQWSLDEFHEIYDWLDARFDHYFYESDENISNKQIIEEYLDKGVLVRSEGAVGVDLTEYKMPFFILLRSDGTGLYSTKDIALAQIKFDEFAIDRSIYVVDASQSLHFQQVFKTLELMGYEKAKQCFHLAYGMVVLPEGKMATRTGNVILFSQLRERLIARIREQYLDKYQGEWPEGEIAEAAKRIAIATIKYGMLNQDNNKNIVFNLDEWTSKTGNTGPYLLYAYARIVSIVAELDALDAEHADWSLLAHETEADLIRQAARFPEVISFAAESCQPHLVCAYLYDVSKSLNRFYDKCHVQKAETAELRQARGLLISAVGAVLQQGLALLGIKTVDKM